MTWLPASEAPTDGTVVLAATTEPHSDAVVVEHYIGRRYPDGSWEFAHFIDAPAFTAKDSDVLGWQALPAVPEGKVG